MKMPSHYMSWYTGMTIRFKLLFWFVPLLMATIFFMGFISYEISSNQVTEKIKQTQDHLMRKTSDQIDAVANEMLFLSNNLFLNEEVQRLLQSDNRPSDRQQVFKLVSNLMVSSNSIQSIILYNLKPGSENLEPFATNQAGVTSAMTLTQLEDTPYYKPAIEANGSPVYELVKPADNIFVGDHYHKIVLSRVIRNIYDLSPAGLIMIGVDAARIGKLYLSQTSDQAEMFLISKEGTIITATNQAWIGKKDTDLPYNNDISSLTDLTVTERMEQWEKSQDWIITHMASETTGWYLVVVNTRNQLVSELGKIGLYTVAIAILCFLLSLFVTLLLSKMITKPIMKLTRSMRKLQTGDFTQRVHFTGQDEIGELGIGYNSMVERMKVLIDDVYASQLKQKEAELKTLQAQISPHFLYNTLNTISWSAEKKGEKDIANMVYSLSQVFRLSLSDGKDFITIEQEMELVRNYLFLQKSRFADRLDFDIHIDDTLRSYMIPKLILQPLVENAVIHGIEPLFDCNGHITLRAIREGIDVRLEVLDNGIGMKKEQLERIINAISDAHTRKDELHNETKRAGFALINIQDRLALFLPGSRVELSSQEGRGTSAVIYLKTKESDPYETTDCRG